MQILLRILLAIYIAHLLTDFVLQTRGIVEQKRRGKLAGYLLHGLTHYFSAIFMLGFFVKGSALSLRTHIVLILLTLVHLAIDFAKTRLTTAKILNDGSLAYLSDQLLHLLTVALAAWLLTPGVPFAQLLGLAGGLRSMQTKWLAAPAIYILTVFGGGYLIRYATRTMAEDLKHEISGKSGQQLQNAGLYIGWLERFLVMTALLLQSPMTIGLIFAAKSIARYPEFKSERFAEYFLIGTLLSISLAIFGGVLLAKVLFGTVRFS